MEKQGSKKEEIRRIEICCEVRRINLKVINYCFSCNKEHDVIGLDVKAKGLKCECGGYYITPK